MFMVVLCISLFAFLLVWRCKCSSLCSSGPNCSNLGFPSWKSKCVAEFVSSQKCDRWRFGRPPLPSVFSANAEQQSWAETTRTSRPPVQYEVIPSLAGTRKLKPNSNCSRTTAHLNVQAARSSTLHCPNPQKYRKPAQKVSTSREMTGPTGRAFASWGRLNKLYRHLSTDAPRIL